MTMTLIETEEDLDVYTYLKNKIIVARFIKL